MNKSALILVMVLFLAACTSMATTAPSVENSQVPPAVAPPAAAAPTEALQPTALNPPAAATEVQPAAAMDGAALLEERCSVCHSSNRPKQAPRSKSDWEKTVTRMIGHGAQLTDAEKQTLVDYLAQTYGK